MALVLDETFAAGIPGSFATARAQAGTLTIAHNAGAQAVDLGNATAGHCIWDITSLPLAAQGEMEIDLEFVSDSSGANNYRAAGACAVAGAAAESNGVLLRHNTTNYELMTWAGATSWVGNSAAAQFAQAGTLPFATAGDRRIFSLRWDMATGPGTKTLAYEGRIDGKMILYGLVPYTALRPGVYLYQSAVRLHSIKAWDAPQASLTPLGKNGLATAVSLRACAPPEALVPGGARTVSREQVLGWRNIYQGGNGRVLGTIKQKNTPANTPLRRRVQLIDEGTRLLVCESWSDAATGAYSFEHVDATRRYTVLSYDHAHNYRAVIADNITPEVLP